MQHAQYASDSAHARVHSTSGRGEDGHMHAAALDSAAALDASGHDIHRNDACSMLSAIAESDENFTTSHTGGMDPLVPRAQQSPGGDSVTSAMHYGAPPSSVAATCASDPRLSPQDSAAQVSHHQVSPQKSHSPSPVRFHASAVVAPEDTLQVPARKLSPVPPHLRVGNLPEPSGAIPSSSKYAPAVKPTQDQYQAAPNQLEAFGVETAAPAQLMSAGRCASGGENVAFAPSPLSRSPAPSRCHSPVLRPTLSPPSGHLPTPPNPSDAPAPPDSGLYAGLPNKLQITPFVQPRLGNQGEQTASPSRSPPPDASLHRGRSAATSPQPVPMHVMHAQRTLSPPRFQMPDSASMHVKHGGLVLPRPDGARMHRVDTHAPHALKVHCVTWNMGRTKATSQLAVHLRGAFLGIPRSKSTPVDTLDTGTQFKDCSMGIL